MIETVDNIKLDKDNAEFNYAAEFVRHTDKLVYLTGKAGTGKTTFLKYIKATTNKNTVILAPTGVAAINAGGVTINSFFQIPFGPFLPDDPRLRKTTKNSQNKESIYTTFRYREDKKIIIEKLELLIIDEISMVRADMLDVIDKILRVFRKPYLPFGGVQVILIGDTFQLAPIVNNKEWSILSQFYKTPYFFNSKVIEENQPVYIELKKIYRQNEQEFIDLLNRVRVSKVDVNDFKVLNAKHDPVFTGNGQDYITLATHNAIVDETNSSKLNQLETDSFTYSANVEGSFPDKHKPTDHYLKLKVGAQVMFVKNDASTPKRYYNGKIGKIKELEDDSIKVVFDEDREVKVEKATWENVEYSYNKDEKRIIEKIVGVFEQFPIRLAWAITVHKSQGLTFEKVIADLGRAFAPGQVYVALSRCTSFSGLVLKTQLNSYAIKTDPNVIEFAKNETPETLITEQLNTGKADFYYKKSREGFEKGKMKAAFSNFKKALKFRNDINTDIFRRFIEVQGQRFFNLKQKYRLINEQFEISNTELFNTKELLVSKDQELKNSLEELSKKNATIEELSNKAVEFEAGEKLLNVKLEKLEKQIATSQRKSERLDSKLKKTQDKLKEKNEKTKIDKVEISELKKELKQLSKTLVDSQKESRTIQTKLEKTSKTLEEADKENKTEIDKLQKDIRELNKILIDTQNYSQNLQNKLRIANANYVKSNNENKTSQKEIERLRGLKWYNKLFGEK